MDIKAMIVPAHQVQGINRVRMLLFGPPKCGKTTWVAHNMPNPIIVDVEAGVVSLLHDPVMRNIDTFPFYERAKLQEFVEFMGSKEGDKYETVVIDTLTEWNAKLIDGITKAAGRPGEPQIQDYGLAGNVMREIIVDLLGMNKHLVVTAHVQDRKFGMTTKTAPALPPKVSQTVEGLFPIIAYMTKQTTPTGVKTKMTFVDTPVLVAGNRIQLPAQVENPTFQTFQDAINNNKPKGN